MFARPPAAAITAPPPSAAAEWTARLRHPATGAAAAGALALAALLALLTFGDPHAGAPSVRVKLADPGALPRGSLRGVLSQHPTLDSLAAGQDVGMPGAPDPSAGEAVITLPQGGRVAGQGGGPVPIAAPTRAPSSPLAPAPIAGLSAPGPGGLLPIVAKDGRTPFSAYSRPFTPNGKPRIALVVGGLGLNAATTRAAIERLPGEVTLSFTAYADGLQAWVDLARAHGHEVMLEAPMEPTDYPNNDPGPYTLMANGQPAETNRRLEWLFSRAAGYFAVTNYLGGRFLASGPAVEGFMAQLRARGLGFLDDGSARGRGAGAPRASADAIIDQDLSAEAVDRQLTALEGQALQRGQAFGAGFAYPVTVETVARWADRVAGRGYQLAPASAITRR